MKLGFRALRGALVVALLTGVAAPVTSAPAQAVAPTGETTLLSPAEGVTVGGNPTFSWTAVPGAARYRVEVSTSAGFALGDIVYKSDTVNRNATPADALPLGTLYWRVAPTDGSTGVGTFTYGSFVREWASGPALGRPADGDELTYPEEPLLFTWTPLPGAQKYNVQVDDDVNFVGATSVQTINTSYTLLDPQTNDHTFYWRVQGVSGSVLSPWSETRRYTVTWPATPILTGPIPGPTVTDVALDWEPVAGAAKYHVQVSSAKDFSNNIVVDTIVLGTRYSPAKTLKDDQYYWRVQALDGKTPANYGAWSAKVQGLDAQFERKWASAPTLLAPADRDYNVVVPLLRWTPVPHASHYEIWLSTDENFSDAATSSCYTNNTSFAPYGVVDGGRDTADPPGACGISQARLPIGSTVFWKVRGIDAGPGGSADALVGPFSPRAEFTFRHDAVPTMTSPPSGAAVTSASLTWNAVIGVARYRVNVFLNGSPISGSPFVTYANSFTPEKLEAGKTYTWYVQTLDDAGRPGSIGGSRSFTFQPAEAVSSELLHVAPLEGAQSMVMPELSWEPVLNAKKYEIWVGRLGEDLKFQGETNSTTFTPKAVPLASGTYLWSVQARDELGSALGERSAPTTFKIGSLGLVTGLNPAKCGVDTPCVASPDTPLLTWDRVPHAGGYRVYLAFDSAFLNQVREYKTQHPALTPAESLLDSAAGQPYYYFVQACRDSNTKSGCGAGPDEAGALDSASQFRKESTPVKLLSPADGVTVPAAGSAVEDITFTWEEYSQTNGVNGAAQGAKTYLIEVATTRDFSFGSVVDTDTVDQATYTPHDVTYPEGPLYWRVRAIDGSGNHLAQSETRLVTKATPALTLLEPAAGQVVTVTPYFSWSAQPHTKDYEVMVARNGDTNFSTSNLVNLMSTSSSLTPALTRLTAFTPRVSSLAPGTYAWRVRRHDANAKSRPGAWSEVKLFTLTTAAPTLLSPATGAVFNTHDMVFDWTPVDGAAKYEFVASSSPAFGTPLDKVQTVMTSWAPSKSFGEGTVYWRVAALNAQGAVTAVSETRSLFRDMAAPKVTAKTPTVAAGLVGAPFSVTFSEPVKNVSASTFGMTVTGTGAVVPGTVTPGPTVETTSATFTPSVPLTPGETYTLALGNAIEDRNGNGLLPFSWSVRSALLADGASPVVQQFWDRDTSTGASGGGYLASRTKGARVSYSFTGTSASILGRRAPDGGYGEVWVDGVKKATVSFYAASNAWKQTIWSTSALAPGNHTVELRVLGTKPTASTGYWVYPDVFRHGATVLEETSSLVRQAHANTAYSTAVGGSYVLGGHLASGDTGGQPSISLKFKGTGVYWRGYRRLDGGVAKIYVDGVAKASVDTYGTTGTTPLTLWSTGGLTNATHTVKIVFAGTKRADSKGYNVTVDSFTVS